MGSADDFFNGELIWNPGLRFHCSPFAPQPPFIPLLLVDWENISLGSFLSSWLETHNARSLIWNMESTAWPVIYMPNVICFTCMKQSKKLAFFFYNVQLPRMKSGPKGISMSWLWFHMSNSVSPSCLQPSQTSRWNPRLWTVNQMSNWRILFPSQLWHCRPRSPCSLLTMKAKSMQAARLGRTGRRIFQRRKRRKKRYTTSSVQEEMFSVSSLLLWLPESNHLSDNVGGPQHIYPWPNKLIVLTATPPPSSQHLNAVRSL